MQGLARIVQSFKPSECQFIRDYYLRKANGSAKKRLQLFDLLKNDIAYDNEKLSQLLYNRKPDSGFSQLKKRLKEDLLDFLTFFPTGGPEEPDPEQLKMDCRKGILQAQSLMARGVEDEAIQLFRKVAKTASKYGLVQMEATALEQLEFLEGNVTEQQHLRLYRQ